MQYFNKTKQTAKSNNSVPKQHQTAKFIGVKQKENTAERVHNNTENNNDLNAETDNKKSRKNSQCNSNESKFLQTTDFFLQNFILEQQWVYTIYNS